MTTEFFADEEGTLEELASGFFTSLSLRRLRRAIEAGELLLNGERASRDTAVKPGDLISLAEEVIETHALSPQKCRMPILFEDEHLIAVDKPAGVAVLCGRAGERWEFMEMLLGHAAWGDAPDPLQRAMPLASRQPTLVPPESGAPAERRAAYGAGRSPAVRFRIVHRLDRDTSGAVVVAKTVDAARALSEDFGAGRVSKRYLVIVRSSPPSDDGEVNAPLAPSGGRKAMKVSPAGKESLTRWRVVEKFRSYALLEARPVTGRTHQIRVHLAYAGMPLAVDPMYGGKESLCLSEFKKDFRKTGRGTPLISRLTLHCASLEFAHPASGSTVKVEAAPPADFERALKALRKYG